MAEPLDEGAVPIACTLDAGALGVAALYRAGAA